MLLSDSCVAFDSDDNNNNDEFAFDVIGTATSQREINFTFNGYYDINTGRFFHSHVYTTSLFIKAYHMFVKFNYRFLKVTIPQFSDNIYYGHFRMTRDSMDRLV